jgi:hypothetical protein
LSLPLQQRRSKFCQRRLLESLAHYALRYRPMQAAQGPRADTCDRKGDARSLTWDYCGPGGLQQQIKTPLRPRPCLSSSLALVRRRSLLKGLPRRRPGQHGARCVGSICPGPRSGAPRPLRRWRESSGPPGSKAGRLDALSGSARLPRRKGQDQYSPAIPEAVSRRPAPSRAASVTATDTSGRAASKSATGSSTPRSRGGRSNARDLTPG